MSPSSTVTIRLESTVKTRLDELAKTTHRNKSFLATEAVCEYLELKEWQIKEMSIALKEADTGDFATDQELAATLKKWGVDEG